MVDSTRSRENLGQSPISTLVNKSGKCEGSSQWHRLSVFSRFTVRSRTCFESVGTTSKQFAIDSSGTERSLAGERRRVGLEKGETRLPSVPRPLPGP